MAKDGQPEEIDKPNCWVEGHSSLLADSPTKIDGLLYGLLRLKDVYWPYHATHMCIDR